MSKSKLYRVTFLSASEVYEIFARSVGGSGLPGFIEVAELVFDKKGSLIVDPTEERLRDEFSEVDVLHLPMHHVLKVEQVSKRGPGRIREAIAGDNVTALPLRSHKDPGQRR